MVVEDEVLLRIEMAEALREAGLRAIEAASADEAMDLIAAGIAPDGIFTDVNMPGALDGWDLVRRVRVEAPHVAVLVASAAARAESGADFMAKPYNPAAVIAWFVERLRAPKNPITGDAE